jgi:UDP-N-acetylglucosamine 3-dehydrogenase
MSKVRIAMVGIGRMGRNHLRVIRECASQFELVAVVDEKAPQPADLGNIPFLRQVSDLQKLDFEAAVIATTTATHFAVASQLIEMGKHVLIEKPIASTFDQGQKLVGLARDKGTKLAVGHVERFNPAVRKLREVIAEGWLGTPIHFSFTRVGGYPETLMQGNNVILDLAVHDIDLLRSMVGRLRLESSICHSTWREGVDDTAEIFLRAADSGASASVHVNWITPTKIRGVRVTGTKGVCFVDYILQTCELVGGSLLRQLEPQSTSFEVLLEHYRAGDRIVFGVPKQEPLRAQLLQLHKLIRDGEQGELASGRDALAAVLLAERACAQGTGKRPAAPAAAEMLGINDEWV